MYVQPPSDDHVENRTLNLMNNDSISNLNDSSLLSTIESSLTNNSTAFNNDDNSNPSFAILKNAMVTGSSTSLETSAISLLNNTLTQNSTIEATSTINNNADESNWSSSQSTNQQLLYVTYVGDTATNITSDDGLVLQVQQNTDTGSTDILNQPLLGIGNNEDDNLFGPDSDLEDEPLQIVLPPKKRKHPREIATPLPDDVSIETRLQVLHTILPKLPRSLPKKTVPNTAGEFICDLCGMQFKFARAFYGHLGSHQGEKEWKCSFCPKKFSAESVLLKHEKAHKNLRPFMCKECGLQYSYESQLIYHERRIHQQEKPFRCQLCVKAFFKRSDLKVHYDVHLGIKKNTCDYCGKGFSHRSNLNRHLRMHTGRKPYVCSICNLRFAQLSTLKSHKIAHTTPPDNNITYECGFCEKQYKTKRTLKLHMEQMHPECLHQENQANHEEKISKMREFYCQVCGECFPFQNVLAQHELERHSHETSFYCKRCDKQFESLDGIKNHECISSVSIEKPHRKVGTLQEILGEDNNAKDQNEIVIYVRAEGQEEAIPLKIKYDVNSMPNVNFSSAKQYKIIEVNNEPSSSQTENNSPNLELAPKSPEHEAITDKAAEELVDSILEKHPNKGKTSDNQEKLDSIINEQESSHASEIGLVMQQLESMLEEHKIQEKSNITETEIGSMIEQLDLVLEQQNEKNNENKESENNRQERNKHGLHSDLETQIKRNPGLGLKMESDSDVGLVGDGIGLVGSIASSSKVKNNSKIGLRLLKSSQQMSGETNREIGDLHMENNTSDIGLNRLGIHIENSEPMIHELQNIGNKIMLSTLENEEMLDLNDTESSILPDRLNSNLKENTTEMMLEDIELNNEDLSLADRIEQEIEKKFEIMGLERDDFPKPILGPVDLLENQIEIPKTPKVRRRKMVEEAKADPCIEDTMVGPQTRIDLDECYKVFYEEGVKMFRCKYCERTFKKKSNFTQHVGTHNMDLKKHSCMFCGATYGWKSSLNKHIQTVHAEAAGISQLQCHLCTRTFKSQTLLNIHIRRDHFMERSFICTECDKKFFKRTDLEVHARTHTNTRPYMCGTCGRTFSHLSHIIKHERIHSGVKPYACDICPKAFCQSNSLKSHRRRHFPDGNTEGTPVINLRQPKSSGRRVKPNSR